MIFDYFFMKFLLSYLILGFYQFDINKCHVHPEHRMLIFLAIWLLKNIFILYKIIYAVQRRYQYIWFNFWKIYHNITFIIYIEKYQDWITFFIQEFSLILFNKPMWLVENHCQNLIFKFHLIKVLFLWKSFHIFEILFIVIQILIYSKRKNLC